MVETPIGTVKVYQFRHSEKSYEVFIRTTDWFDLDFNCDRMIKSHITSGRFRHR